MAQPKTNPQKHSRKTFPKETTISRREALKRIAFGVPMIATVPSWGANREIPNGETRYQIVESTFMWLQRARAPEELIKKLQPLQGKWFLRDEFAIEIERLIGKADFEAYFPIMLIDITHRVNYPVENCVARGIIGEISSNVVACVSGSI